MKDQVRLARIKTMWSRRRVILGMWVRLRKGRSWRVWKNSF